MAMHYNYCKKLNSLQHLVRTTVATSHNDNSKYQTRSSAIADGPRDASCQLKSCQLPSNSAEITYTTSPEEIDGMKLEI